VTDTVGPDQGVQGDAPLGDAPGVLDCGRGGVESVQRHPGFEDMNSRT
jgi:hypothetical protein